MEEYYSQLKEAFDLRNDNAPAVKEIEDKLDSNLNRGFEINNQVFSMDKESIEYGILMKEKEMLEKESDDLKGKKDELENYITSIVKASSKPVFVKTRIGPNDDHITIYENLKIFEKANVTLVAIHARSRIALYSGEPHYDIIKRAKDSTYLPILANGNIGVNNFEDVLNYTNADGVMIGRETLGYPKIFKEMTL